MKKFEYPINVTKSFLPPFEEYESVIKQIWNNRWLTNNGPIHMELENEITKYLKVNQSTLFTNGHLALDIAIKSMNLKGEVITTPFTFASTAHAIVSNNLKPVFCDINLKNFTIDVEKIEALITDKTCAIIPVHVFGYPCNVKAIEQIAKKYNLKVIYDAAHVFGVEIDGIGIGNYGDISMFSLHATKVYNSIEGGLLTFKDDTLKDKFNSYKNFGISDYESVKYVGSNAKMNEFQAAMGLVNLRYINEQIINRKIITDIYKSQLKEIEGIYMVEGKANIKHNYAYFPIIIDENKTGISRDELYNKLQQYNVFARKYFYPLITDFDCYKNMYQFNDLYNAKYISDRVLILPLYGDLLHEDVLEIVDIIKHIIQTNKR
ncbi:DegT/DnrJ/EryC1/StrS family aminotransferase [Romboutsia sedimentorum]|uniref:DegT/DnrJ/EryC1/StrS family aminotransferase n=1 Tax=Romboutsia sedimentorum TaxID=1368474 RepID=A0ABT7EA52_9FIRM|nr:DegT/DnrJ/EryC1/StrS family aminotransferase [Romboutsia sedimentorum]MDK2563801.1 DegT/DnrJ/EryC1/StrS family aminotransferase [Romboutsia sedimentorum]